MCGRDRLRSDKKKIADAFRAKAGLPELQLAANDDITPGSLSLQWAGLDTCLRGLCNSFWESVTRVSKGIVFAG